jgi:hypothetical protein
MATLETNPGPYRPRRSFSDLPFDRSRIDFDIGELQLKINVLISY